MIRVWVFLAGLLAGLGFLGGSWRYAWIPAAAALSLSFLRRDRESAARFNPPTPPMGTQTLPPTLKQPKAAKGRESWDEEPKRDTVAFLKADLAQSGGGATSGAADPPRSGMRSREERRRDLQELEEALDGAILDGLALLKHAVPGGHTYAVFFPGKGDGLYLRAWITESRSLVPGASIQSHQGLVGQLLKEGVKRILEGDIVADSTQLHYYSGNEGVRSMAAVPVTVKGVRRGAVVVDSLGQDAFDPAALERLEGLANLVGRIAYHAYMDYENSFHKDQLAALSSYQRKFLENMSVENIVTHVVEYMGECLEGDRFLVIGRDPSGGDAGDAGDTGDSGNGARVIRCVGADAESYQGFGFSLQEKGLVALAFEKEQIINRSFAGDPKVARLSPREPSGRRLASLLAVPVATDRGVDMALAVESARPRRFSDHQQNMLATIARAAGFALSRARLYQHKEQLASRDGLTGVENHRSFQERFLGEILRAQRYGHHLAVLMMDIDFFKKVNDTYGHPMGDQVLKEVARIIGANIRAGVDILARYGGEEFVCMLADTDRGKAGETAERIRTSVSEKVFESGAARFQVTMSIGGAIYPLDSRHGREVLEKADKALYHAKETGRNRLVFYN
jgi:diguanylate cyclase (GGDEF)-like protein